MTADVRSIAALRDWYAALTGYGESLAESLAGVDLELRRGFDWLDEQVGRWQKAVRECEEEVVQAKAELSARKFTGWDGREPDTTVQERALRRAKARLEYAEDQVRVVRSWIGRLPKLIDELYRGPASRLSGFLEADLPRGLAALGRKIETLETYAGERTDFTAGRVAPAAPTPAAGGRPVRFGTTRSQVYDAQKTAQAHWQAVEDDWNDAARRDHDDTVWTPLDQGVSEGLRAIDELSVLFSQIRTECEYPGNL